MPGTVPSLGQFFLQGAALDLAWLYQALPLQNLNYLGYAAAGYNAPIG